MSYTVLARRYRSTTFDEVVGQEHVAQTLKKAIESDRIAHAYLFTGTRGVGKTSMARILAKALNCHSFDKPTPTPCGTCDSCQRIAKGDDMDVIEIDAASNTGVDNVRDLIENSQYRPSRSRFKVYIIDEVHMLSKAAFNALLKTMEEPPSHVKFILATTEVEKVLPTILSRCQRYDFRNIPTREIAGHLKDICKQEKVSADEDALLLVAKAGAGSMRDALSLLDRLLSVGEKKLTSDLIEQMLGLPKSQLLFDLAQAVGNADVKGALEQTASMINAGQSVDSLIAALVEHLRNLLILRTCGPDSELVEVPGLSLKELTAQAERFDPVALVQDIAILEELRRHVRQSQAGRALLDATLVRMALSDQFASIAQVSAEVDGEGRSGGAAAAKPAGRSAAASAPVRTAADAQKKKADDLTPPAAAEAVHAVEGALREAVDRAAEQSAAPASTHQGKAGSAKSVLDDIDFGDDDLPRPGKVWDTDGPSLSEMVKSADSGAERGTAAASASQAPSPESASAVARQDASQSDPSAGGGGDDRPLPAVWTDVLAAVAGQAGLAGALAQMSLTSLEDGVAMILVPARCETFAKTWERNGKKDTVRDAVSTAMGRSVGIRFVIEDESATGKESTVGGARPGTGASVDARTAKAGGARPTAAPGRADAGGPPRSRGGPRPTPPPPEVSPQAAPQRITAEQEEAAKAESPLVKALVEKMGGRVVRIE